jgi:hypothetical protein
MSKAVLFPMLLMLKSPRLLEQQALFLSSDWQVTIGGIEALTGFDLGSSDRKEMVSRLSLLLAHLLKWEFLPSARSEAGHAAIRMQRVRILMLIMNRPGLARYAGRILGGGYRVARGLAMAETGLRGTAFPDDCPYSVRQALDSDYFPAAA